MGKITGAMQKDIRSQAERFLKQHGFDAPPLDPGQALNASDLTVTQLSLDDLLVRANLPLEEARKIQAMLDAQERAVTFRRGLPVQQRNWGALHEVGHEFLPWQRELLYACPLLLLPAALQRQLEAEADLFAAEAFFFGGRFTEVAKEGTWGLATAVELAERVYNTSFHATFRHYVEQSEVPCCLLVWRPPSAERDSILGNGPSLHYYVKSRGFRGHIDPGQTIEPDSVVSRMLTHPSMTGIVRHEVELRTGDGRALVAEAESFSNSYTVFTLIPQPLPTKFTVGT